MEKIVESNYTTKTFAYKNDGFMVDIVDTGYWFEAFLYHKDWMAKYLMFGISKKSCQSFDEFKDFVFINQDVENCIQHYQDEYLNY